MAESGYHPIEIFERQAYWDVDRQDFEVVDSYSRRPAEPWQNPQRISVHLGTSDVGGFVLLQSNDFKKSSEIRLDSPDFQSMHRHWPAASW